MFQISGYGHNDILPAELTLAVTKIFPDQTFQQITGDSTFNAFPWYGQPEARVSQSIPAGYKQEAAFFKSLRRPERFSVIGRVSNPVASGKVGAMRGVP